MISPSLIRYYLAVEPSWEAEAAYSLSLLLEGMGLPGRRVYDASQADLVYARQLPESARELSIWIRADQVQDWNHPGPNLGWVGELPVLYQAQMPQADRVNAIQVLPDIVYSTYALVTGALEQHLGKDEQGCPYFENAPQVKWGIFPQAVVGQYTDYLLAHLGRDAGRGLQTVPRWPGQKKYAVVLSHDVDMPFVRPPMKHYVKRFKAELQRRNPKELFMYLASGAKTAAWHISGNVPPVERDPNLCFDKWIALESSLPTSSCFYVAVTSSADPGSASQDVVYDFREPFLLRQIHSVIQKGWEVGLHASINARFSPQRFVEEKSKLESSLNGYRLRGLRHHWWSLNPDCPEETLKMHADAGFDYDTSLGMNDAVGFRRGMAWPFEPFDRTHKQTVPILEIPPTLMDGNVFYKQVDPVSARREIMEHFQQAFKVGGAVVLDWHMEQMNPTRYQGAGTVLADALRELADDENIYWASPCQMTDWWRERRKMLEPQGDA